MGPLLAFRGVALVPIRLGSSNLSDSRKPFSRAQRTRRRVGANPESEVRSGGVGLLQPAGAGPSIGSRFG